MKGLFIFTLKMLKTVFNFIRWEFVKHIWNKCPTILFQVRWHRPSPRKRLHNTRRGLRKSSRMSHASRTGGDPPEPERHSHGGSGDQGTNPGPGEPRGAPSHSLPRGRFRGPCQVRPLHWAVATRAGVEEAARNFVGERSAEICAGFLANASCGGGRVF